MSKNNTIAHVYTSPGTHESRINKQLAALKQLGVDRLVYVGYNSGSSSTTVKRFKSHMSVVIGFRVNQLFGIVPGFSGILLYIHIIGVLFQAKARCVHCHSILVLPPCVFWSAITRSPLIYDTHELESERLGLYGIKKSIFKLIESLAFTRIVHTFCVSEPISDWYRAKYSTSHVSTVRNIPSTFQVPSNSTRPTMAVNALRSDYSIPDSSIVCTYAGLLSQGRRLTEYIRVFSNTICEEALQLVIIGYGPLEALVREAAQHYDNIHFIQAVPEQELMHLLSQCDIGLVGGDTMCLSYELSLPNKYFQYLMAGLPVLAPENRPAYVDDVIKYNLGWTHGDDSEALLNIVSRISIKDIEYKKRQCRLYSSKLSWQKEGEHYARICQSYYQ